VAATGLFSLSPCDSPANSVPAAVESGGQPQMHTSEEVSRVRRLDSLDLSICGKLSTGTE